MRPYKNKSTYSHNKSRTSTTKKTNNKLSSTCRITKMKPLNHLSANCNNKIKATSKSVTSCKVPLSSSRLKTKNSAISLVPRTRKWGPNYKNSNSSSPYSKRTITSNRLICKWPWSFPNTIYARIPLKTCPMRTLLKPSPFTATLIPNPKTPPKRPPPPITIPSKRPTQNLTLINPWQRSVPSALLMKNPAFPESAKISQNSNRSISQKPSSTKPTISLWSKSQQEAKRSLNKKANRKPQTQKLIRNWVA